MISRVCIWLVASIGLAEGATNATKHWAFIKPVRPALPQVRNASWPRNAIDYFVLARLEKEGIGSSPEAARETLVRRLYLDLIGLPPGPLPHVGSYEDLVESLLASAHHGERWARWWLDVARYADSNGYSIDAPRSIWKYREWVINALNRDLLFDQFVIDQLAGDLLPNPTVEQKIATGFNRNTQINQEGGIDPEQFRVECVMDRVNTTATAFLGLTVACAQCHDHKYDPISQREYYQFYAFFNNAVDDGHGKGAPDAVLEIPGEVEQLTSLEKEIEEAEGDLDRYLNTHGNSLAKMEQSVDPAKLKPAVREAIAIPFAERTLQQKRAAYAAFRPDDAEFKSRNAKLTRLEKKEAKPISTLVMRELEKPRESVVFIKGDFTRRGEKVSPGILRVLHSATEPLQNRLDLAEWLVHPDNPLLARVIVNRVWQQYFGRGIVETENDFGVQATPPTHPELLDWLATEFMRTWSLKHIHRLIVSSATYRQSSKVRPELATSDPNNKLLARQNRLRLDAEIVRDVCLVASGLLNPKIGGPSVFPPQPTGVMTLGQIKREWKPTTGADRYRRGMYTFFWRATPHPALMVFDSADGFSTCTRRIRSNTPLQALTLLNDEAFYECAQALAKRIEQASSNGDRIEHAFGLCVSRKPSTAERDRLSDLLKDTDWPTVARVLLNLDETITRE